MAKFAYRVLAMYTSQKPTSSSS